VLETPFFVGREFVDWDFGIGGVDRWGSSLFGEKYSW